MNFDPVAALRQADEERFAAVQRLGQIREQLKNVVDAYHDAYKLAREHGGRPLILPVWAFLTRRNTRVCATLRLAPTRAQRLLCALIPKTKSRAFT